jgi:hypothetical protein
MKSQFNKYWIIVVLVILANIGIFVFFSNNLESYIVTSYTTDSGIPVAK